MRPFYIIFNVHDGNILWQHTHTHDDDDDDDDYDGNIPMQPWFGLTQPLSGWVGWIIRLPLEDWGTKKGDIDYNIDYNNDANYDEIDYNNDDNDD